MKAPIYNLKGKTLKKIELSEDIFGKKINNNLVHQVYTCLLYTSPSPRDATLSRMPSSA